MSVSAALDSLDTELPPPSPSAKGADARDASLGRVFGCAAIARGGGRELAGDKHASARVARALGAAALSGKSYAREAAAAALGDAAGGLSPTGLVDAVSDAADGNPLGALFAGRSDARALAAAEAAPSLLLALRLWPHLPAEVAGRCPLLPEGGGSRPPVDWCDGGGAAAAAAAAASTLLTPAHAPSLAPALADAAGAHPRLHGAWTTLLALALPGFVADGAPAVVKGDAGARTHAPPAAPPAPLRALWAAAVDAALLTAASPARRGAALALAGVALPRCGPEGVPCVLTPATARALAAAARDPASPLHAAATRTLDRVVALAQDRGARWAAAAAAALTAGAPARGGGGFDARSGTKAVARLLEAAGDEGASAYADELMVVAEAALAAAAAAPAGAAAAGSDDDDDAPADPTRGAGAALDQLAAAAARGGVAARARVAGWLARVALTARVQAPAAARAVAAARALGLAAAAGSAGDAALTAACDAVDAVLARGGGGLVAEGGAATAAAALARVAAAAAAAATPTPTPTSRAAPSLPDALARLAKLWRLYVLADSDGDGAAVAGGAASDFEEIARAALKGETSSSSPSDDDPWPDRLVGIVLALASAAPAPPAAVRATAGRRRGPPLGRGAPRDAGRRGRDRGRRG